MELIPIPTPLLKSGDDLARIICECESLQGGDILVISSKAVATIEGAEINLESLEVSDEARVWAERHSRSAPFRQAVIEESARLNGHIVNDDSRAILTELQPEGLTEGTIMVASAGLDQSNIEEGYAIGWPHDPVASASAIREGLKPKGGEVAVIISDSCLRPRRRGLTAMALVASGIDPLASKIGKPDLYKKELKVTYEAVADQLATAANFLMGNGAQSMPAVIVREHGLKLCDFEGWVPGITREEDIFHGII